MWALVWKGICPPLRDSLSDRSSSASVSLHNLSWLLAAAASACENQYNTTAIWKCTTPNFVCGTNFISKTFVATVTLRSYYRAEFCSQCYQYVIFREPVCVERSSAWFLYLSGMTLLEAKVITDSYPA